MCDVRCGTRTKGGEGGGGPSPKEIAREKSSSTLVGWKYCFRYEIILDTCPTPGMQAAIQKGFFGDGLDTLRGEYHSAYTALG